MSDLIDRQAAIDALKTDMASLDHIIKGMSAYDVRLDAYVSQRNQVNCDIDTINNLPTAQPQRTEKCMWCERLKERNLRIEYYWIDEEGCTASFYEPHIVATGIAKFCPNCGAKITEGDAE